MLEMIWSQKSCKYVCMVDCFECYVTVYPDRILWTVNDMGDIPTCESGEASSVEEAYMACKQVVEKVRGLSESKMRAKVLEIVTVEQAATNDAVFALLVAILTRSHGEYNDVLTPFANLPICKGVRA